MNLQRFASVVCEIVPNWPINTFCHTGEKIKCLPVKLQILHYLGTKGNSHIYLIYPWALSCARLRLDTIQQTLKFLSANDSGSMGYSHKICMAPSSFQSSLLVFYPEVLTFTTQKTRDTESWQRIMRERRIKFLTLRLVGAINCLSLFPIYKL